MIQSLNILVPKQFSFLLSSHKPFERLYLFNVFKSLFLSLSARSSRTDESFGICHFQNDPPPIVSRVRSALNKVLLRKENEHNLFK